MEEIKKKRGRPKRIILSQDIQSPTTSIQSPQIASQPLTEGLLSVSLKVLGKVYTAKGKTIKEALDNLSVPFAKGKGILTLQKGTIKKEKVLNPMMTPRLFGHFGTIRREIAMKQLCAMFDSKIFE